jgi:hypothetical protein
MSAICNAYTCKGTKCTKALFGDYCKEHQNSMKMIGPMRFRQNQERYGAVAYYHKSLADWKESGYDRDMYTNMKIAKSLLDGVVDRHALERRSGPHTLADQQSYDRLARHRRNRREIREGLRERENVMYRLRGDGRDELLQIRQARLHYIDMVERREMTAADAYDAFNDAQRRIYREQNRRDVFNDEQGERDYHINYDNAIPNVVDGDNWLNEPPRERTLAEIAADRQNIHTSEVVKKFKEMVEVIRKIEVPEEYRWNMTKVSKTMSEIISECELTPQAAWQFSSKYCADDTIYEMEAGIFGKLMDAVWQHVKNLDDPASLKQIVKEELEMNIGTCAQGNLTRVANILVGILDGLNPEEESRLHKIGRAINDVRRTLTMGMSRAEIVLATMKVLVPFGMTAAEMKPWVDAVADSVE